MEAGVGVGVQRLGRLLAASRSAFLSVCSVLRGQVWEMNAIPHLCRRIFSSGKTHS